MIGRQPGIKQLPEAAIIDCALTNIDSQRVNHQRRFNWQWA